MADLAKLSGPELELSQVVARLGEATVRAAAEALPAERGMGFATVQTYLRRLHAKGYLAKRRDGRADVYRPAVRPAGVVRSAVRELVDRVFAGDALPLVQHLIDDRKLTDAQLDQLQAHLDARKSKRKGKQ
jgi:BlaI family penicillinase repressor